MKRYSLIVIIVFALTQTGCFTGTLYTETNSRNHTHTYRRVKAQSLVNFSKEKGEFQAIISPAESVSGQVRKFGKKKDPLYLRGTDLMTTGSFRKEFPTEDSKEEFIFSYRENEWSLVNYLGPFVEAEPFNLDEESSIKLVNSILAYKERDVFGTVSFYTTRTLLTPVAVAADIVTSPIQLLGLGILYASMGDWN